MYLTVSSIITPDIKINILRCTINKISKKSKKNVFLNTIIVLWPLMSKLDYGKVSNCPVTLSLIIKNNLY